MPLMETLAAYMPMDRRQALARGENLPERAWGATLFADISGFTPLTEALAKELGPQRGAEELSIHLNHVYDALIETLHNYGGSVIGFSGDAITCWLDGDDGLRATACAMAMHAAMRPFHAVHIPSGRTVSLAVKIAIAVGEVRRFIVGDPKLQVIDVMSGATLDLLATAEHLAGKGEVLMDAATAQRLGNSLLVTEWREKTETGQRFAVISGLAVEIATCPWPALDESSLPEDQVRPWLLPALYERLRQGKNEFLAELRPAIALFIRFNGIDYDHDDLAAQKLNDFVVRSQSILNHFEGVLIQLTIGDKGSYLYAAFGAPFAHEDDSSRAGEASLKIRAMAESLGWVAELAIGIAKGRIMRTGPYGGASCRTYGALGEDTNLAARLMQAAGPWQILAAKRVYNDTISALDWEQLAAIQVKGKTDPVPVFSLKGYKTRVTFRLKESAYKLPMVGRQEELAAIEAKMDLALQGSGQVIGITGEAGMGKSRLAEEVIRLANNCRMEGFGGECQSYGTNASYLVWQNIWRGFFSLQPDWELEEQIRGLEIQLLLIDPSFVDRLPLLGPALGLPIPDNDLTYPLDAKIRKSSLEALLVDCVRVRAMETPLFFLIEDSHWIDPLSHDLLEVIGRAIANLPVLLVMIYRPLELDRLQKPRLSTLPYFTEIQLNSFSPEEARVLIDSKASQLFGPGTDVPPGLVSRMVARAEGNPFFIEELLNFIQDSSLQPQDKRALELLDLPTSLQSLILSRIDQLNESQKITIRVASVIGRLFEAAMLWGAYSELGDEQQVRNDLRILNEVELTILDNEPELSYFFKHIVTQEVAYESLPFATRASLHEQIARYLEQHIQETGSQSLDLLAFHYGRSENLAKKREYLMKAGEAAQSTYANDAAVEYYQRALPLLSELEQTRVRFKLGQVMETTGQWKQAIKLYRESMQEAAARDDCRMAGRCQTAMGELFRKRGLYTNAARWLRFARHSFEKVTDEAGVAQVLNHSGSLQAQQGNYQKARQNYEESLKIWRRLGEKSRMSSCLSNLGIVARFQGEYEAARTLHLEGLAIRRELGDRWAIAVSLNNLGNVEVDLGDYESARRRLEEAVALQREIGDKYYIANSVDNLGTVMRCLGDYRATYRFYKESLEIIRELGDRWMTAYILEDFGMLAALQGQHQRAVRLIEAAGAVRESIQAPLSKVEEAKLSKIMDASYQALLEDELEAARAGGRMLTAQQAIEEALNRANQ